MLHNLFTKVRHSIINSIFNVISILLIRFVALTYIYRCFMLNKIKRGWKLLYIFGIKNYFTRKYLNYRNKCAFKSVKINLCFHLKIFKSPFLWYCEIFFFFFFIILIKPIKLKLQGARKTLFNKVYYLSRRTMFYKCSVFFSWDPTICCLKRNFII